jgi:hypothetical protein
MAGVFHFPFLAEQHSYGLYKTSISAIAIVAFVYFERIGSIFSMSALHIATNQHKVPFAGPFFNLLRSKSESVLIIGHKSLGFVFRHFSELYTLFAIA